MTWRNKPIHKFYAFALAAVFAVALAGCGGGGGKTADPDPTPQEDCVAGGGRWNANDTCTSAADLLKEKQAAQRTAISNAITTAQTAVAGLTDDASDTAINSADSAVAAAKKAIADAADIPAEEKAAFNTAVSTIEGSLTTKKASIADARDDADKAMKAAMTKMGKAMHAALGPPAADNTTVLDNATVSLSSTGLTVDAAEGAGALTTNPESVTLKAGDSAGSLSGWKGMDYALTTGTGASKITNEARVFTNKSAAKTQEFTKKYTDLTAGYLTTITASLVGGSTFTHSGTQNHAHNATGEAAFEVRGTYDGAPGQFKCTGTCTSTNDGKGSPSALGGTWSFKPDVGAMVSVPDAHYLYFGWWVRNDKDGAPTAASAFTGRFGTDPGDSTDSLDPAGDGTGITGSATYTGNAAGIFAMSNPLDGTGDGGDFTADATLEATFGSGATAGMTGTIDNFRLNGGSGDPGWSVKLNRATWGSSGAITAPTSDPTVWSINGNEADASGTWSGQMYDEKPGTTNGGDGSNIPTTVTGTFSSEFSTIGRMVGAFGADKQ